MSAPLRHCGSHHRCMAKLPTTRHQSVLQPERLGALSPGHRPGFQGFDDCSLKGCDTRHWSQPFRLNSCVLTIPRALPWAECSQPFGLKCRTTQVVGNSKLPWLLPSWEGNKTKLKYIKATRSHPRESRLSNQYRNGPLRSASPRRIVSPAPIAFVKSIP